MLTRLLADLHHAAHDDVVDERRVEVVALGERLQHLGGQVDRVPVLQLAVALAASGVRIASTITAVRTVASFVNGPGVARHPSACVRP